MITQLLITKAHDEHNGKDAKYRKVAVVAIKALGQAPNGRRHCLAHQHSGRVDKVVQGEVTIQFFALPWHLELTGPQTSDDRTYAAIPHRDQPQWQVNDDAVWVEMEKE